MHREKVWVDVETAFADGLVVSFTDECGAEYRGALLRQTNAPPLVTGPNLKLANPLSLLHDHPYADIQQFGRKVCREVPAKVLLGWSMTGLSPTPNHAMSTRNGFVRNQKKHKMIAVVESNQNTEQHRQGRETRSGFRHEDRNAKLLATLKMRSGSAEYSIQALTNAFSKTSYTLQPKKLKPKVTKRLEGRKRKRTIVSVTAQPGNTKPSTSSRIKKQSSSSVTTQVRTTGPLQPVTKDSMADVQCSKTYTPAKLAGRHNCTVDISPTKVRHRMLSTGQFSCSPPASVPASGPASAPANVPQSVPELNSRMPVTAGVPNTPLPVKGSSPAVVLKQEGSCPAVVLKHVKTFSIPLKRITVSVSSSSNTLPIP